MKMLHDVNTDHDDKQFQNEFFNLCLLKHQNIVQILGYCYESKQIPIEYNRRTVLADKIYRVLCFEYLDNGSLQNHLSGMLLLHFQCLGKKNVLCICIYGQ